eukprot:1892967-Prymnesium_polylepis.1
MKAFSTALASGAMAKVQVLDLRRNTIGDEGMSSFSTALASGAMAKLKELYTSRPSAELKRQGSLQNAWHQGSLMSSSGAQSARWLLIHCSCAWFAQLLALHEKVTVERGVVRWLLLPVGSCCAAALVMDGEVGACWNVWTSLQQPDSDGLFSSHGSK